MSCGGTCTTQVFFLHDLSESVLSLPWVFSFCRVPFDSTSFLGVSSDLLAASPQGPFHAWKSVSRFLLDSSFWDSLPWLMRVASLAVCALRWGLTTEPVGGSTSGDFSQDFIFFFFFLSWSLHHCRPSWGPLTLLSVPCNA